MQITQAGSRWQQPQHTVDALHYDTKVPYYVLNQHLGILDEDLDTCDKARVADPCNTCQTSPADSSNSVHSSWR